MTTTKTSALSAQARQLPPSERIDLVEDILQSLDTVGPELEKKWADEAKDRLAAYKRGELASRDFDEVLAEYDKP